MPNKIIDLEAGLEHAYINGNLAAVPEYTPTFVSNNPNEGKKVLCSIEDELLRCDEFRISVAFVTMGGIAPLLQTLRELERKGIPGRILTTNYLNFSEPAALRKLHEYSNIELRMFDVESANVGFHTKGYIFKKEEIFRIIIGSSNLTKSALTTNFEWNTKLVSTEDGEITREIITEFENLWSSNSTFGYEEFHEIYEERFRIIKHQREIASKEEFPLLENFRLKPNSMQEQFVVNLRHLIDRGEKRALLVSSTGTGKTFASAFAMRELGFKRVLFMVHRNQIAIQTMKAYKRVFDKSVSMGLVGGGYHEYNNDFVFANVFTLNKDTHLFNYEKDAFDCIILDEAHHSTANVYQKVMDYFEPDLFLGMTATPDKRDESIEGRNVYELFDYNIAHEIRLQQAMKDDLLCPFHYFGVTDLSTVNDIDTNKKLSERDFRNLTSDERVKHIINEAEYYGFSGDRVKGLIFCSRIEESIELSRKLNEHGLRTIALNGSASEQDRAAAFERLAMDEDSKADGLTPLDYILSVDILNEGVDIVEVNQVIMLRPTESPIVFIQQLGRGLRKARNKDYVIILDFIGNYKTNFMIPIALSGDKSYNKDTIRKYVMEGGRVIPGASTIHFDEVSRKKIYESIDRMSTTKAMLTEKYNALKNRQGRIPTIVDFFQYGELDPTLFIEYSKTYDRFVRTVDKDYTVSFTDAEETVLEFISNTIVNGKRIHELLMMIALLNRNDVSYDEIKAQLKSLKCEVKDADIESAKNVLLMKFINSPSDKKKYSDLELIKFDNIGDVRLRRSDLLAECLSNGEFKKELSNLLEYGVQKYLKAYAEHDRNNLVLYEKYSRKDVCRILNWEKDDSSTMYGYKIKYNTCPIFVTYEKSDDIAMSTNYNDEFELIGRNPNVYSNRIFSWMTRSRVKLESTEAQQIIDAEKSGLKILLFLKKSDGEGTDFYYMGEVKPVSWKQDTIKNDKGVELPIVNFKLQLENEARADIFDYFIS